MARKLIHEDHKAGKNNRDKLATFTKILREFKPVFHYFFTEHYLDPVTWYERRLAYNKRLVLSYTPTNIINASLVIACIIASSLWHID